MAKMSNDTSINVLWENNLDTPITAANLSRLQDITTSYLDSDIKNHVENSILFYDDNKLYIKRGTIVQIINEAKDPVTQLSYVDKNSHYKLFDIGLEDLIIGIHNLDDTAMVEKVELRWGTDLNTWYVFICDKEDTVIIKGANGSSYGGGAQILISKNSDFPEGQIPGRISGFYSVENTRLLGGFKTNNDNIIPDSVWDMAGKFQRLKAKDYYILDEYNDEYRQIELKDLNTAVFNELNNDLQIHGDLQVINVVTDDIKTETITTKSTITDTLLVNQNSDFLGNVIINGSLNILDDLIVNSLTSNGDILIKNASFIMTENDVDYLRISHEALDISLDTIINGDFINNANNFAVNIAEDTGDIRFYGDTNIYGKFIVYDRYNHELPLFLWSKEALIVRDIGFIHLETSGISEDESAISIKGQSVSIISTETSDDKVAVKLSGTLSQNGIVFLSQNGFIQPNDINKLNALSVYNNNDELFFSLNRETNEMKITGPVDIDLNVIDGEKVFAIRDDENVLLNVSMDNNFNIFTNLNVGKMLMVEDIATFKDDVIIKGDSARVESNLFVGPLYEEIFKIENNVISLGRTMNPIDIGDIKVYGDMVVAPGKTLKGVLLGSEGSYVEKWSNPITLEFLAQYADTRDGSYVLASVELNGDLGILRDDKRVIQVPAFEIKSDSHSHREEIFYKDDTLDIIGTLCKMLFSQNDYENIAEQETELGLIHFNNMIDTCFSLANNISINENINLHVANLEVLNLFKENISHYLNYPSLDPSEDTYEKNVLKGYISWDPNSQSGLSIANLYTHNMIGEECGFDEAKGWKLVSDAHSHPDYVRFIDSVDSDHVAVHSKNSTGKSLYPVLFGDNPNDVYNLSKTLEEINMGLTPKSYYDLSYITVSDGVNFYDFLNDSTITIVNRDSKLVAGGAFLALTTSADPYVADRATLALKAEEALSLGSGQAFTVFSNEEFIDITQNTTFIGEKLVNESTNQAYLDKIDVNIELSSLFFDLLGGAGLVKAPYIKYIMSINMNDVVDVYIDEEELALAGEIKIDENGVIKLVYSKNTRNIFKAFGVILDLYNDPTEDFINNIKEEFNIEIKNGDYYLEDGETSIKYTAGNQDIFRPVDFSELSQLYKDNDLNVEFDQISGLFNKIIGDNKNYRRNQYTLYCYQDPSSGQDYFIWRGNTTSFDNDIDNMTNDVIPLEYYYYPSTANEFPDFNLPSREDFEDESEMPGAIQILGEYYTRHPEFSDNDVILYIDNKFNIYVKFREGIVTPGSFYTKNPDPGALFPFAGTLVETNQFIEWVPELTENLHEIYPDIFPDFNPIKATQELTAQYVESYLNDHPQYRFNTAIISFDGTDYIKYNRNLDIDKNTTTGEVSADISQVGDIITFTLGNHGSNIPEEFPEDFLPEFSDVNGATYIEIYTASHPEYRFNTDIIFIDSDGYIWRATRDYETGLLVNGSKIGPYDPGNRIYFPSDFDIRDENSLENGLRLYYLKHHNIIVKNYNVLAVDTNEEHGLFINDRNQVDFNFNSVYGPGFDFDPESGTLRYNNEKRSYTDIYTRPSTAGTTTPIIEAIPGTFAEKNFYATRVTLRLKYHGIISNTCDGAPFLFVGVLTEHLWPDIPSGESMPLSCIVFDEVENMAVNCLIKIRYDGRLHLYPKTPYTWSINNPIIEFTGTWLQYREAPWKRSET
jgi:hypothetical protein